jgi:hypothetical protein
MQQNHSSSEAPAPVPAPIRIPITVRIAIYGPIIAIVVGPFLVAAIIIWVTWPAFRSVPPDPHRLDNALIAIASVGGVLWSGAIITYSIHQRYSPGLRTAVQLIHYTFLAPLIALIGEGAGVRIGFLVLGWFYAESALVSFVMFNTVGANPVEILSASPIAGESPEQARQRAQDRNRRFFERLEHGRWYFASTALICFASAFLGRQDIVAWSCLLVVIMALFLILPELFELVETGDKPNS